MNLYKIKHEEDSKEEMIRGVVIDFYKTITSLMDKYEKWAYTHNQSVKRNHPKTFKKSSINDLILADWLKVNKDCTCKFCGAPVCHIDHVIPLSKGGPHELDNLRLLCKKCNIAKLDDSEDDFLAWIERISNKFQENIN